MTLATNFIPIRPTEEELLREAAARLGDPLGARGNGAGQGIAAPPVPQYETDPDESDLFVLGDDTLGDPKRILRVNGVRYPYGS